MSGFIMMMTQQGKLLYISENAADYLGHSMEDLLIHGDSVYDVIDKQDHMIVQNQLSRNSPVPSDRRLFLCRINVSRNSRRQLRFGDQKVILVEGHFLPFVPVCNRNEFVFLASCTPVVLPETRESIVQGATNIFTTIHSMDMKYLHIDKTAESHLEYSRAELVNVSWYNLLHWDSIRTAYCKHQTVIQSDQERSTTALLKLQSRSGRWFWVHCVLQVKDTSDECQHPIIVCTNQVLTDKEAEVMRASSWLYQYSSQTKFTYGLCPSGQGRGTVYPPAGSATNQVQEYVRTYSNDTEAQHSPSLRTDRSETESHGTSKIAQPTDYPGRRLLRDDAEPVDMSISGTEQHEGRGVQGVQVSGHQQHILDDPVRYHHKQYHKSSLHLAGYRAKFVQCHGTQYASGCTDVLSVPGTKYYLTDLDRDYCCGTDRSGLSLHKRLPTKTVLAPPPPSIAAATAEPPPPPEATPLDNWGANPAWSDTLQRVPDVMHQELSPYITTPTTPVNTPDSDTLGHSEAPIFNFDWTGTEQHVPNLKITFHRGSVASTAAGGHPATQPRKQHQDSVQPITLQLPRRKGQSAENDSKDFPK
ncbi:single-minded homolog 1-A-like [Pogonomyrmex barbatus]|uniref:Single-minded homolog 1-A-like n=1 Tax=Pogonomyrmex barbatus TaxID=144034 RepID=A0A6I9WH35_9HYME|nr:single-minded homolog 1-A-like [Pogonomyrmex barbatus]